MSVPFIDENLVFIYKEVVTTYLPDFVKEFHYTPWIFSLLGSALIGLSGILPLAIIPAFNNEKDTKDFKDREYFLEYDFKFSFIKI